MNGRFIQALTNISLTSISPYTTVSDAPDKKETLHSLEEKTKQLTAWTNTGCDYCHCQEGEIEKIQQLDFNFKSAELSHNFGTKSTNEFSTRFVI